MPETETGLSKILRLEQQPSKEEVLPFINIITERTDVFNLFQKAFIEVSLTQLRDEDTNVHAFRYHVARLTDYLLQAMLEPKFKKVEVITPLGKKAEGLRLEAPVAIFYINRAGLTEALSAARFLASSGAPIGEFDIHRDEETLEGILDGYNLPPDISGRKVFLLDPMNATGGSIKCAWKVLREEYLEKRGQKIAGVKIGNIISAPFGVAEVKRAIPQAEIFTVALDNSLTRLKETEYPAGYIDPGLGDAGDRQFGKGRLGLFLGAQEMLASFVDLEDPSRIRWTRS